MRKRLLGIGAVIALFLGVFLPARMGRNPYPRFVQEDSPVLLTETEKAYLADVFVEKAAYTYRYYRWFDGEDLGFSDKGYCREDLEVALYWKDGVYYFIPLADCNGEVKNGTGFEQAKIDVVSEQCVFHKLWQGGGLARDFGTWELDRDAGIPMDRVAAYAYLGVVEIDAAEDKPPSLLPLEQNEYIEAAVDALRRDGSQGKLPEDNYKVYIGRYEYSENAEQVVMTGVMERDIFKQGKEYRWFQSTVVRNPDGSYDAKCGSHMGRSEKYPVMEGIEVDKVMHIVAARRLVTYMQVDWDEMCQDDVEGESGGQDDAWNIDDGQADVVKTEGWREDGAENRTIREENIRPQISIEEAQRQMEELYTYYQWFYADMPYEIENLLKEGETYRIYTDVEGKGDIFWLKKEGAGKRSGQDCYGGICGRFSAYPSPRSGTRKVNSEGIYPFHGIGSSTAYPSPRSGTRKVNSEGIYLFYRQQSQLQEIGTMTWHKPDFRKPELPQLTEDEYIRAVKEYLQEEVLPKGENSKYRLTIGRYEMLSDDVRAISAAVTGAEEYYLYCLVTRYNDGTYGCFAAGGSYAGEWESGRKKVERIVELDRLTLSFVEENVEEIGLYRDILENCERVWEEPAYYQDHYELDGWGWIQEYTCVYGCGNSYLDYGLEYSFQDLNHDGTAELIVGIRVPQTDYQPEEYWIAMVCYYDREGLSTFFMDRYFLHLYQGGVIEEMGGWYGYTFYNYYILDELVDSLRKSVGIIWEEGEEEHFYIEEDGEKLEITQEEFEGIRQKYTGAGEIEITGKELKGFWRP